MATSIVETLEDPDLPKRKRLLRAVKTENLEKNIKQNVKRVKQPQASKCDQCKQYLDEVLRYNGHPNGSSEEIFTLSEEKFALFSGNETSIAEIDAAPCVKLTNFSVYDMKGHLCSFDSGLIEKNVPLYFSGYVKPIYEENPSPDDGCPTFDIGPINVWWTAGFDGGEKVLVGVASHYAEYYLMEPSPEYEPFWKNIHDKVMVWKLTIEFLLDESWRNPSYEDLLQHLETSGKLAQPEETLLRNAQFVCDQVDNYFEDPPDDEPPLITLPCMRSLVKLAGITFKGRAKVRHYINKSAKKKATPFTKATTTKLVRSLFENIFPDQIENQSDDKTIRKKRCGVCESCQQPDCGNCSNCKNMLKFGGNGKSKQACKLRKCSYMAIQEAEESDNDDEKDSEKQSIKLKQFSKRILHSVEWLRKPTSEARGKTYYDLAKVGDVIIKPGDYVMLHAENPNEPFYIAEVSYMYETALRGKMFHSNLFCRGNDSILGETADPRELFAVDECEDCPLGTIVRKAEVEFRQAPENWANLGGNVDLPPQLEDNGYLFFVSKRYDKYFSCFTDFVPEQNQQDNTCNACKRKAANKNFETPSADDNGIQWKGQHYSIGTAVFMNPDVYNFRKLDILDNEKEINKRTCNGDLYPEFYRKTSDQVKGSNYDTVPPFVIGIIEELNTSSMNIKVRLLCRPDDTKNAMFLAYRKDLNLLYWTEILIVVSFENVTGMCHIAYGENIAQIDVWSKQGPDRFYFDEAYDFDQRRFYDVPTKAMKVGDYGKGKGKGKRKSVKVETAKAPAEWETLAYPLKCMDVFAGCGGLSEGLHQAGIAETKWAIEKDPAAAQAFKLNNPDCNVFNDDCNEILRQVISGEGIKRGLPNKGEVELLVGGPPCQGFSGMNRFSASQYSLFKDSQIVTCLSCCDFYRPKYFILENVRNFVSYKRGMVLKLTIRCLLAMGYQVAFGILQAGHYGVPQTRRRLIIMAAAPGYYLPKYPEPQHVFNKRGCQLSFVIDNVRFVNGNSWIESAPYRTICVRDAMSDLPDIINGWTQAEMPYDSDPISHFQKMMRYNNTSDMVRDHICKEMSAIVEGRISHIPTYPGADWRDLPNISMKLSDGTMTKTLRYPYRTTNQSKKDPPRGVCACSVGMACDPTDRQTNTLIPWCLPHTADRHNHWAGLYGRLEWDGFFGTTITNPEPMGKQGRVLHPEQARVVSVRECARSQGFPDCFRFYGSILDKHRQVGNAVPPPLGYAIGLEIRLAYIKTLKCQKSKLE